MKENNFQTFNPLPDTCPKVHMNRSGQLADNQATKSRWSDLTIKETVSYLLAIGALLSGYILLFLGMYLPPAGEIHHSVLTAFGITGLFTGSLLGITMHYTAELDQLKDKIGMNLRQEPPVRLHS